LSGCGYIGEPRPPALHVPQPVADLRVLEYGDHLIFDFTIPPLTTEGLAIAELGPTELLAGPAVTPFDLGKWEAGAETIPLAVEKPGAVQKDLPAGKWVGKDMTFAVRLSSVRGRKSALSNAVTIPVQPPLPVPAAFHAESTAAGVKLTWSGTEPSFRVLRQGPGEQNPSALGETNKPEYLDPSAQFDRTYRYIVQALSGKSESEISAPVSVTPKDVFPPAVPSGLTVVSGIGTIELAWDRDTDSDLKGYRVYRAAGSGEFQRVAEVEVPAYSDREIESGKRYRYAISAVDQSGNESARSAAADAVAQ
jgi:hypothetical protein